MGTEMEPKRLSLEIIQDRMQKLGLTQSDLALKVGVSKEAISQWLKGAKFPRPLSLMRIAETLNLTFDELVSRAPVDSDPVIAFRKKAGHKVTDEYIENAKHMGRVLEELVPYLPFDTKSRPPSLIDPKIDYHYIHSVALEVRKEMGKGEDGALGFEDIIRSFTRMHAVVIPVFWGDKRNHENALHIYTPKSMTTWIYLNLDSKIHDFKFWMAHELGHVKAPDLREDAGEDFAEDFAGALLVSKPIADRVCSGLGARRNDTGAQIVFIKEIAERLMVSPITVYREACKYATNCGRGIDDLETKGQIFKATTNFARLKPTVAHTIFGNNAPSAADYLNATERRFQSPIFDAMKKYLRERNKNAGFVQSVLNVSLGDAQYLFDEIC